MKLKIKKRVLESLLTEKDNRRILIDKEGVSEEIANWAHELSDKLSIWIVKSLKVKYANDMANVNNKISLDDYYRRLDDDYRDIIALTKKQNKPNFNKLAASVLCKPNCFVKNTWSATCLSVNTVPVPKEAFNSLLA